MTLLWTVMCSYNKINGIYAAENKKYLTDVLRGEWGFDGYVVSDWGAVNNRVADLQAGLDLEMPSSQSINDRLIVEAIKNKGLKEEVLDREVPTALKSMFADIAKMLGGGEVGTASSESILDEMIESMMFYMPLRGLLSFASDKGMDIEKLQGFVDMLNRK